jgi:hypothetical protein
MRGEQRVILALWSAQQMERDEAGHVLEMGVAAGPDRFEIRLGAADDLEAIHGDEHRRTFRLGRRKMREKLRLVEPPDALICRPS